MNLRGEHIFLRALEPTDLDVLYKWENNPTIWKVSNTLNPFSKFVLEQYLVNAHDDIFSAKQIRLMVCSNDGRPAGTIELFDFDALNSRVGIGILIEENSQNKGYAFDALQVLIKYCFEILMLKQIYCNISASNEKSIRLFKKLNFTEAGMKKSWNKISQNTFEDEYLLQLVR